MQPDLRDASYLWDILDAARAAIDATQELDFAAYERNAVLRAAAERWIEIIGEAANRVSKGFPAGTSRDSVAANGEPAQRAGP